MGMADIFPAEYFVRFHGSARADQLPFAEEVGDSLLDLDAGLGAGNDEGVIPDAQRAAAQIIRIEQRGLESRDESYFAVRPVLGKDAEAIPVEPGPELDLLQQFI
jgi:hypothetical protein